MPAVIETDLLIGYIDAADKYHPFAAQVFDWMEQKYEVDVAFATSAFMEYDIVLRSKGKDPVVIYQDIQNFFTIARKNKIPVLSLTRSVYETAIHLRNQLIREYDRRMESLLYQDSLHIATALFYTNHLVTTDELIRKIVDEGKILVIKNLVVETPGNFIERMRREKGFP